jgi:holo-[acyl-carrier protein] synthase
MTIIAIGNDLARIDRLADVLERRGQAMLDRLFTSREQAYCEARRQRSTHYAGRFAVKEAVMKVLGTGWSRGVRWVDIEVLRERGQPPRVVLHGRSAEIAAQRGIARIHITITHDGGLALATAVAEGGA